MALAGDTALQVSSRVTALFLVTAQKAGLSQVMSANGPEGERQVFCVLLKWFSTFTVGPSPKWLVKRLLGPTPRVPISRSWIRLRNCIFLLFDKYLSTYYVPGLVRSWEFN